MRSPQQKPRSPGLPRTKNAATRHLFRGIKGRGRPNDGARRDAKSRLEIYRRLQSRDYSIACGISREARRLRSINHTSLWLGAWTPTPRTRTARSAACRCNCGAHRPRIIWVPPIPVSTATGAASSSTSRRARRLWNSSPQRSRRARFLPSACLSLSIGRGYVYASRVGFASLSPPFERLNMDTNSAAANAARAAAHIVCSGNRSCPSPWPSPCTAHS